MAYTLLKARGVNVGSSRVEEEEIAAMKYLLDRASDKIILPIDHIATDNFDFKSMSGGKRIVVESIDIPEGLMGMDIGQKTIAKFREIILRAKTIVWNGPMGVFEAEDYVDGTKAIALALAEATERGAITIVGGGDSASAVEKFGLEDKLSHISTGGGASIEFLEGKELPGVSALD